MSIERSQVNAAPFLRLLRRARYSFLLRAAIVMSLGTAMSCSTCGTLANIAAWAGCNACSQSSSSGCGSSETEDDTPSEETECNDGVDDDADDDVDCDDLDCRRAGACGEYYCYDEVDDDDDGAVDCDDRDCCDFEDCRCQCEARCELGTELCISDAETCAYECCSAGQECVDGRCAGCTNECGSGYVPCWSDDERCALDCCTAGQACTASGCQCQIDCEAGTQPCLTDEWTCSFQCCREGDVCRSGQCAPIECATAVAVDDASYELDLTWSELDDAIDVAGLEGCAASAGAEMLLDVRVPAGEAVMIDSEQQLTGMHVLDGCLPTRCLSSLSGSAESSTLWINGSSDESRVFVLLEAGGDEQLSGQLRVSSLTGQSCDDAIEVVSPTDGFSWTADSRLFREWSEEGLCGMAPQRLLWLTTDVDASERLDVLAWGDDDSFTPSIAIVDGSCGEPTCLALGDDMATLRNDLGEARTYNVAISWSADYLGDVNVELSAAE